MTCRVSIEEERHDRETTDRQKRIDALYIEKVAQYQNELHAGEIGEACSYFGEADEVLQKRLVAAYHARDFQALGEIVSGAIGSWIALQASKEVERAKERGVCNERAKRAFGRVCRGICTV